LPKLHTLHATVFAAIGLYNNSAVVAAPSSGQPDEPVCCQVQYRSECCMHPVRLSVPCLRFTRN